MRCTYAEGLNIMYELNKLKRNSILSQTDMYSKGKPVQRSGAAFEGNSEIKTFSMSKHIAERLRKKQVLINLQSRSTNIRILHRPKKM